MPVIALLAPGGVGGFLAAALARRPGNPDAERPKVIVVARKPTAALIAREGIAVRSVRLGDFVARPQAVTALRSPVDVLLVATKATSLRESLKRIETSPPLVVPLLNGLDHMTLLRERFGAAVVAAGTIRIESDRPAPARIVQSSPFLRVDLAADDPALLPRLEHLETTLRDAGVPAEIGAGEAQILWSKLVRLVALACTTSAADETIGAIRSDPEWRAALTACIEEAAAVARAEGAEIDPAQPLAELDQAHPELGSSMQRDLAAGREPELDAIAGAVLRAASENGLSCPTIARLTRQIAARAARTAGAALPARER
ncbi:MAG: ketopantoate reductase family protein [Solirubrobacteraceae bacterium]